MSKIYADITKTVGNTPLVRINKMNKDSKAKTPKPYALRIEPYGLMEAYDSRPAPAP